MEIQDDGTSPPSMRAPWKESLFGCFDDMSICCYGFWCHPCLYGENAEKIDGSGCAGNCCLYYLSTACSLCCIPHMIKRKALRDKYRLEEEPCHDCLVSAFCAGCSVCQEARELKARAEPQTSGYVMPVRAEPRPA